MTEKAKEKMKEKIVAKPALLEGEPWMDILWDLFCPGCQIPLVGRIIAESLEELGVGDKALMVGSVGCTGILIASLNMDRVSPAHGRGPDVATALKRIYPNTVVFTVQGDGDCIAIGAGSLVGALSRGEKFTVIMVNNTNYGTTGGQLAPTTLIGQVTSTTPRGRDPDVEGYPMHAAEFVATFKGVAYSARGSLHTPADYRHTKNYVKTTFQRQLEKVGTSFVEIIASCPTNWHMTPVNSLRWIEEKIIPEFPLGEFRNVTHIE